MDRPQPITITPVTATAPVVSATEGDRLLRAGDLKGAAARYARAARQAPADLLYQMIAGVAYASAGRMNDALAAFRRADKLSSGRDVLASLLLQGIVSERLEDSAEAQAAYARTVQRFSIAGTPGLDTSMSVLRLQQARIQLPQSPVLALLLGDAFQLAEQWTRADGAYREAIALAPLWAKPRINLGLSQIAQGRSASAVATFQGALAIDPNNAQAQIAKADAQLQSGLVDAAVASYKKVENSTNNRVAAQAATGIGQAYAYRGRVSDAVVSLNRAQQLTPADPAPAAALGEVQLQAGNYSAAAKAYDDALRLSRGGLFASRAILYRALAETQLSARNSGGAIETIRRAMTDEPSSKPLWYRLWAQALYLGGDATGGGAKLKLALEAEGTRYPQDALNALASRGLLPGLKQDYRTDLDSAKDDSIRVRSLRSLANIARFQGEPGEEVVQREALVKLKPAGTEWHALAEAYERRGADSASALAAYRKALALGGLTAVASRHARERVQALDRP